MTRREIIIAIGIPLLLSGIYFLIDLNTHDGELAEVETEVERRLEPLEHIARQDARKELRVLSKNLVELDSNQALTPAQRDELRTLYEKQLDAAQAQFDEWDND